MIEKTLNKGVLQKLASSLVLFYLLINQAFAAHIVGGDMTYVCSQSTDTQVTLTFTFTLYRDDTGGGADFDQMARFGIYQGSGNLWSFVTERVANPANATFIDVIEADPCVDIVTQVRIERATYTFSVTLDKIDQNYMIAYQRCCRNDNITNLVNSGEIGAAFTVEIYPAALDACSSSPVFNQPPPNIICANFPVTFDYSATDPDGDDVTYSFCTPETAGGTDDGSNGTNAESCTGVRPAPPNCRPPFDNVNFGPGFSGAVPIPGDPALSINPNTGLVSGRPNQLGLYVIGVCLEERRNGELFTVIRQDYQINVGICSNLVEIAGVVNDIAEDVFSPPMLFESTDSLIVNACGDLTVVLGCESCSDNFPDADVLWELYLPNNDTLRSTEFGFEAEFPAFDIYEGLFFFQQIDEASGCNDTIPILIDISPPTIPDFELVFDTCGLDPIIVQNQSINLGGEDFEFEFFVNDKSIGQNEDVISYFPEQLGELTFEIRIMDQNGCGFNRSQTIQFFPTEAIDFQPSSFVACQPATITFSDALGLLNDDFIAVWDFGDGSPPSNEVAPTHVYEDVGFFTVTLELSSPDGSCTESYEFENFIEVRESPIADFTFSPENPSVFEREVDFTDLSIDAIGWQWDFGGVGTSFIQNPTFTFPDTGIYDVRLIAVHESTCPDTAIVRIDISPEVRIFFPNAFTPNNDAKNDEFKPLGIFFGITEVSFSIWNRWGEQIYVTDDFDQGWNGLKNNVGQPSPEGVYVYRASFVGPRGNFQEFTGHVTLLR